jgi:hypothetical protein
MAAVWLEWRFIATGGSGGGILDTLEHFSILYMAVRVCSFLVNILVPCQTMIKYLWKSRHRRSTLSTSSFEEIPNCIVPKPKILGNDVAGIIVEVGKEVKDFKVGDQGKKVKSQPLTRSTSLASHLAVQKRLPPTPIMSMGHTLWRNIVFCRCISCTNHPQMMCNYSIT